MLLWNAILLPWGDQVGRPSVAVLKVSGVWLEPSAFITKMSASPSRVLMNAILPLAPGKALSAGLGPGARAARSAARTARTAASSARTPNGRRAENVRLAVVLP